MTETTRGEKLRGADNDRGLRRLLRFLTDHELEALGTDLGLRDGIDEEQILAATSALPRYETVRLFLRAATPTLLLLRQVFDNLDTLGVHVRTTGCLFILANPSKPGERTELLFSPQAVGLVAAWPIDKNWMPLSTSLQELGNRWSAFDPVWRRLLNDADPSREKRVLNARQSSIYGRPIYGYKGREDLGAQEVLRYFLNQVATFRNRLEAVPLDSLPPEMQSIVRDSGRLLAASDSSLSRGQGRSPTDRPREGLLRRYVSATFVSAFDRFMEDLHLLADLIHGEGLLDLFRLDIWSSRPQLYEVWVMLSILKWLVTQGYKVELRRARRAADPAAFEWDLAYSRDSQPCATVFNSENAPVGYLFYQLYRTSGDMPDISMLEHAAPSSTPIWSVDPKHSPRAGYRLAHYRQTAERYRDSFGAKLSLVAECFPRPWSNPTDFGRGAKVIVDCSPSGSGLPLLLSELGAFHPPAVPPPAGRMLLCIDLSASFASRRASALRELRDRLCGSPEEHRLLEEYVCFAGNAVLVCGTATWLIDGTLEEPGLTGGTSFEPLFTAVASIMKPAMVTTVVLVTDGGFDIALEIARKRLEVDLGLDVSVVH